MHLYSRVLCKSDHIHYTDENALFAYSRQHAKASSRPPQKFMTKMGCETTAHGEHCELNAPDDLDWLLHVLMDS